MVFSIYAELSEHSSILFTPNSNQVVFAFSVFNSSTTTTNSTPQRVTPHLPIVTPVVVLRTTRKHNTIKLSTLKRYERTSCNGRRLRKLTYDQQSTTSALQLTLSTVTTKLKLSIFYLSTQQVKVVLLS